MSNEKFFRMLSIALLGALALACVPDSQASSAMDSVIPVEIEIVREVDEINAGRFNPALAGDLKPTPELTSSSTLQAFSLTQFDPNL